MKRSATFIGLLVALLLLAACGPAEAEIVPEEAGGKDIEVLVYASPL